MTRFPEKTAPLKYVRELLGVPETVGSPQQLMVFSGWVADLAQEHGNWWVKKYRKQIRELWRALESKKVTIEKSGFRPYTKTKPGLIVSLHQNAGISLANTNSNRFHDALISNFSADGMYCESTIAVQPQSKVKIKIGNHSADFAVAVFSGTVKWCRELNRKANSYSHGLGIQIDKTATDVLYSILDSQSGK